jgi:hypothetical protein
VAGHGGAGELKPFVESLADTKAKLQDATLWLMQNGLSNPDNAAAASADYLHLFALTGLAFMWALMADAALGRMARGDSEPFYANKIHIGRHFIERILPAAGAHLARIKSGARTMMSFPAEAF